MVVQEQHLLQRLRAGDQAAREEIVDGYMSQAYDYLCMITGDTDLAADLTQETLIRVWVHLDRFRGESSLSTWVKRIALNEFRQHLRRSRRREAEVECEIAEIPDSMDIAAIVTDDDTRRMVRKAVEALPPIYRQVVVMHCYGGALLKDVAEALGLPLGTAKWRLSRAVRILRTRLAEIMGETQAQGEPEHVKSRSLTNRTPPAVDEAGRRVFIRPGS